MSNKTSLFIKIAAVILILLGFANLYYQMSTKSDKSIDEQLYQDLHGHGSMNVVFAVMTIILIGLFITLWKIEGKVSKLEKEINERKS